MWNRYVHLRNRKNPYLLTKGWGIWRMEMVFILFAKRNSIQKSITIFAIVSLLIIGSLNLIPFVSADESTPNPVPAPTISERHEYNVPQRDSHGNIGTGDSQNEVWSIQIIHGGLNVGISVANTTGPNSSNRSAVGYGQSFQYYVGGKLYIGMLQANDATGPIAIFIGNQNWIKVPLSTCDDFEVEHSPVKYDGDIATLDLNITFERIQVYQSNHTDSTFNLTLLHHFRLNWNQSNIKVEALFDFSHTRFYYQFNGTEFNAGEPFTVEIHYNMLLGAADPGWNTGGALIPTKRTNTTLEYNLTLDNGSRLTMSKLEMKDSFTIYNGTGGSASVGYSSMWVPDEGLNANTVVTHGFPNLTYKDTQSMKSDPEIIVYHDRVTVNTNSVLIVATGVVVAVVAIGAVVFMRKRKKNEQEEGGKKPKKP